MAPIRLVRDDKGATAIEYALIVGMIAIVIAAGLSNVGAALNGAFVKVEAGFHSND